MCVCIYSYIYGYELTTWKVWQLPRTRFPGTPAILPAGFRGFLAARYVTRAYVRYLNYLGIRLPRHVLGGAKVPGLALGRHPGALGGWMDLFGSIPFHWHFDGRSSSA